MDDVHERTALQIGDLPGRTEAAAKADRTGRAGKRTWPLPGQEAPMAALSRRTAALYERFRQPSCPPERSSDAAELHDLLQSIDVAALRLLPDLRLRLFLRAARHLFGLEPGLDAAPGDRPPRSPMNRLTTRQKQVMDLVLAGQASKTIAADLHISQRTVENHRAAIMRRTGAKSLPALARMAVGLGDGAHGEQKTVLPVR